MANFKLLIFYIHIPFGQALTAGINTDNCVTLTLDDPAALSQTHLAFVLYLKKREKDMSAVLGQHHLLIAAMSSDSKPN